MCLKNKTSGYSCELASFVKGLDVTGIGRIQGYPKRLSPARFVEYIDHILLGIKPPSERFLGANNLFTGLVEEKAFVHSIESTGENVRLCIKAPLIASDAKMGDSISTNGCCLTIVEIHENLVSFDAVPETMQRTNLGELSPQSPVNLERALLPTTRLGGHYVTGHIDGVGEVHRIEDAGEWRKIYVAVPVDLSRQMATKGSVAIDGVSLTLVDVEDGLFSVVLIPHTLEVTTIGDRQEGDRVNIETDLLAKYVDRQLNFLKPTES